MRELNRLGLTSAIDAGGGFQNYPDDYAVDRAAGRRRGELTLRIAYNLFTQKPKQEKDDFLRWTGSGEDGQGDDFYRLNGAGEMLVFSAADFEDFLEPRPEMPPRDGGRARSTSCASSPSNRWPFRLHATYDESIARFLDVFERVNRDMPLDGLRWFFDHAETISDRNPRADRARWAAASPCSTAWRSRASTSSSATARARPRRPADRAHAVERGIPVGAGTDATRVVELQPVGLARTGS